MKKKDSEQNESELININKELEEKNDIINNNSTINNSNRNTASRISIEKKQLIGKGSFGFIYSIINSKKGEEMDMKIEPLKEDSF